MCTLRAERHQVSTRRHHGFVESTNHDRRAQHANRAHVDQEKVKLIHTSATIPTLTVTTGSRGVCLLFPPDWVSKKQQLDGSSIK